MCVTSILFSLTLIQTCLSAKPQQLTLIKKKKDKRIERKKKESLNY